MDATSGPEHLANLLPNEAEVLSVPRFEPRDSVRIRTSKLDICCSGPDIQNMTLSKFTRKGTRNAGVTSITESSAHTTSSHKQGENNYSPLRLALARRLVKNQIFKYMDRGDKKTDIESRTGLSHQCIKWHRRLWRDECSHPRPLSSNPSKYSARGAQSLGTRSERPLRRRPTCEGKGDSSVAREPRDDKRRRKHQQQKRSEEGSVRTEMEMGGSGGYECAEKEATESSCFACKEDLLERNEAMAMSGGSKILPFRGSVS